MTLRERIERFLEQCDAVDAWEDEESYVLRLLEIAMSLLQEATDDENVNTLHRLERIDDALGELLDRKPPYVAQPQLLLPFPHRSDDMRSADAIYRYVRRALEKQEQEHAVVVCVDGKCRPTHAEVIANGSVDRIAIHARDVFRLAIRQNAAGIILAHGHPSGDPDPSDRDLLVTEQLVEASRLLEIFLLDHVIVGDGAYASLRSDHPYLFREETRPCRKPTKPT